tara:strand:+ start:443 stop:1000 length:558 start_codon:yes stop_codon:yes gene_type:complete
LNSKSTFSNSTSNSYALALFELAKENSELDLTEISMTSLKKLLVESFDFKEMILSPVVNKNDKKNVILKIATHNNFPNIVKNFLGLVALKNRLFFLSKIINSFLNLISANKGELKAKIISSKILSIDEQEQIQIDLSKEYGSKLKIDYNYEPNLIGGLIIQVGSVMIDTSIRSKLKKLEKKMLGV